MASAVDPGAIPLDYARFVKGFIPGRNGELKLTPALLKLLNTDQGEAGDRIVGAHYFYNPNLDDFGLRQDRLLVFRFGGAVNSHSVTYDYDTDGRLIPTIGVETLVGFLAWPTETFNLFPSAPRIRSAQYRDEVFICGVDGMLPSRYCLDPDTGAELLYYVGMDEPEDSQFAVTAGSGPGKTGTFDYLICWEDERGRYSSPSVEESVVLANEDADIEVTWPSDEQVRKAAIFRRENGSGTNFYLCVGATGATDGKLVRTSFLFGARDTFTDDTAHDDAFLSNPYAPLPGQNDKPLQASVLCIHGDRLVFDDRNIRDYPTDVSSPNRIQYSNSNAPTQFSSVTDLDLPADGTSLVVGSNYGDEVTGLVSHGSILGVFKRQGYYQVWGDSPATYRPIHIHDIGNVAKDSLRLCGSMVIWRGEDGIYQMNAGDGGATVPVRISDPIENHMVGRVGFGGTYVPSDELDYEAGEPQAPYSRYTLNYEGLEDVWPPDGVERAPDVFSGDNGSSGSVQPVGGVDGGETDFYDLDSVYDVESYKSWAFAWYSNGIYYYSQGMKTFALDIASGAWTDCGYGQVAAAALAAPKGYPDGVYIASLLDNWQLGPKFMSFTSRSVSIRQDNSYNNWLKRIRYRAFDGAGVARNRLKRAECFTLWGDIQTSSSQAGAPAGTDGHPVVEGLLGLFLMTQGYVASPVVAGEIRLISDSGYQEVYPIFAHQLYGFSSSLNNSNPPRNYPRGMLLRQRFTPAMRGRLLEAVVTFVVPDLVIRDARLEYTPLE